MPLVPRFGTFLLNDKNGRIVDVIEHDCNFHIFSQILQKWILGTGKHLKWQVLVNTLHCQLNVLADQIQEKYLLKNNDICS